MIAFPPFPFRCRHEWDSALSRDEMTALYRDDMQRKKVLTRIRELLNLSDDADVVDAVKRLVNDVERIKNEVTEVKSRLARGVE